MRKTPLLALLGLAACGGGGTTTPMCGADATYTKVYSTIIQPSCLFGSACHDGSMGSPLGKLDLSGDAAKVYKALVNAPIVDNAGAKADGDLQVVPSSPDKSFVYKKVTLSMATGDPKYKDRMPQGNPPLEADRVDLLKCWIENGAKND